MQILQQIKANETLCIHTQYHTNQSRHIIKTLLSSLKNIYDIHLNNSTEQNLKIANYCNEVKTLYMHKFCNPNDWIVTNNYFDNYCISNGMIDYINDILDYYNQCKNPQQKKLVKTIIKKILYKGYFFNTSKIVDVINYIYDYIHDNRNQYNDEDEENIIDEIKLTPNMRFYFDFDDCKFEIQQIMNNGTYEVLMAIGFNENSASAIYSHNSKNLIFILFELLFYYHNNNEEYDLDNIEYDSNENQEYNWDNIQKYFKQSVISQADKHVSLNNTNLLKELCQYYKCSAQDLYANIFHNICEIHTDLTYLLGENTYIVQLILNDSFDSLPSWQKEQYAKMTKLIQKTIREKVNNIKNPNIKDQSIYDIEHMITTDYNDDTNLLNISEEKLKTLWNNLSQFGVKHLIPLFNNIILTEAVQNIIKYSAIDCYNTHILPCLESSIYYADNKEQVVVENMDQEEINMDEEMENMDEGDSDILVHEGDIINKKNFTTIINPKVKIDLKKSLNKSIIKYIGIKKHNT